MFQRSYFLILGQLLLVLAFLCAPIADNAHAMRMLQSKHGDTQNTQGMSEHTMVMAAKAPCHQPVMLAVETAGSDKTSGNKFGDKKPCCPYKQCSPSHCLIHVAVASAPSFEIIPHSPLDSLVFLDADIHLVSMPFPEPLRPPIA